MTTLIGTNPDQIPVNSMLGGMAYQDPDSINVKDFNSSGTANIASLVSPTASISNLSYSGTLTGGTGVINIGTNQIYKDASGNVGLGAVPISNGKTLTLVNASTGNSSFYLQNSTTGFTATDGTLLQLSGAASYLWNFENSTLSLATNNTEFVRLTSTGDLLNLGTGATKLQEGTTAQRPASPQEGMIRKNSTLGVIEGYSGGGYVSLEAGRLINVRLFKDAGVHSSFILDPKTEYIIVEMVGGGGGGGQTAAGPYATNGFVNIASSGGAGIALRFLLRKPDLQTTMYYYIGNGGAPGGVGGTGSAGGTTTLSKTPTNAGLSAYIHAHGGDGGERTSIAAAPLGSWPATVGGYLQNGINAQILEIGRPRGVTMSLVNNSHQGVIAHGNIGIFELNTVHSVGWAYHDSNIDTGTVFSFGAGGSGTYAFRNDTLGSYYSGAAVAGFKGMIRIYEYS